MERRRTLCQLAISNNYFVAKLNGEVVVITGDSSGIREATAETLAEEGAMIAVAARREERLSDQVERLNSDGAKRSQSSAT
jgi:NADP-dependent 3-hydroxy acid dehydrogenase YdfG